MTDDQNTNEDADYLVTPAEEKAPIFGSDRYGLEQAAAEPPT